MKISLIAALDEGGVIGWNNKLPWHLPQDLKHFKKLTMGKPIVMGRKTHESLGRALPGRKNIILSRNKNYSAKDCFVISTIEQGLECARDAGELIVIGGSEIYKLYLPIVTSMYLTVIHERTHYFGDAYFPRFDRSEWRITKALTMRVNPRAQSQFPYSFLTLNHQVKGIPIPDTWWR